MSETVLKRLLHIAKVAPDFDAIADEYRRRFPDQTGCLVTMVDVATCEVADTIATADALGRRPCEHDLIFIPDDGDTEWLDQFDLPETLTLEGPRPGSRRVVLRLPVHMPLAALAKTNDATPGAKINAPAVEVVAAPGGVKALVEAPVAVAP